MPFRDNVILAPLPAAGAAIGEGAASPAV